MVRGTGICLRSFGRFVTAIVVLATLPTCLVFAQTSTATILGVVKDTTGALIPGVSITIKHTDTGQTRTAISSETGDYIVQLLPVGEYEITTTMPSFKQQVRSGINLVVGQQAVIDLTLEVGAPEEKVVVTEEAPLVNTTLSSTSGLITEQQVKELPLNGRSFDQLLALNVGVVFEYGRRRLSRFLGRGPSDGSQPVSDQRRRLGRGERSLRVHHTRRGQRSVARGRSGAGIQRPRAHLWRGIWETVRRAGQHCDLVGNERLAWQPLRVSP